MKNSELLDYLYENLERILAKLNSYALNGGYVMSNHYARGFRKTVDIDMSISSKEDFLVIQQELEPILNELCNTGEIFSYKFKLPKVDGTKNVSGGVKLYRKPSSNNGIEEPKRVVGGIDISIHDLSFGISVLQNGLKVFSAERSIIDKVSVLYSDKKKILRRVRDLYDLYLFSMLNTEIDINIIKTCINYRNIDICSKTVFAEGNNIGVRYALEEGIKYSLLLNNDIELIDAINDMLEKDIRVEKEIFKGGIITVKDIFEEVLSVLDLLRKVILNVN